MIKKVRTKAQQAITNKRKGSNLERALAKIFRDIGYSFCKTSRLASRLYDNCGIDLHGIPFLVQAKNVKAAINYGELFKEIEDNVKKNFPPEAPEHKYPIMIFHHREKAKLVIMQEDDFLKLIQTVHDSTRKNTTT